MRSEYRKRTLTARPAIRTHEVQKRSIAAQTTLAVHKSGECRVSCVNCERQIDPLHNDSTSIA